MMRLDGDTNGLIVDPASVGTALNVAVTAVTPLGTI